MSNCICINGQRVEMTDEQVEKIIAGLGQRGASLSDVPVGATFKIWRHEFVVLEQLGDATAVIRKDPLDGYTKFNNGDKANNYEGSDIDAVCNEFADEIASFVGEENLLWHTVDLTTDDGLEDYGKIQRRASLLTTDLYRCYVKTLDRFNPGKLWWLATALSTKTHEYHLQVKCVSVPGYIVDRDYYYDHAVARPFLLFRSNIFVSK